MPSADAVATLWHLPAAARELRDSQCTSKHRKHSRIAWFHCPKCGTSFATTLFHYANHSLPPGAQVPTCTHGALMLRGPMPCTPSKDRSDPDCSRHERCLLGQPELTFFRRFPLDDFFHCIFWEKAHGNMGGLEGIDARAYERFAGRFFGFFRPPHKRVASAYAWFQSEFALDHVPLPNATFYAQRARGTVARMLAGQADGHACNSGYAYAAQCDTVEVPNLALALTRLHDGFAYVGLTEQWALSICLFHFRFGGPCRASEFDNSRPTSPHTTKMPWAKNYSRVVAAAVEQVDDPWDSAVYVAAEARFKKDVRHHALTPDKCAELCPHAPHGSFTRR